MIGMFRGQTACGAFFCEGRAELLWYGFWGRRTCPLFVTPGLTRGPAFLVNSTQPKAAEPRIKPVLSLPKGPGTGQWPQWANSCQSHIRSEEHTSELQSLMRNSYAVFCLKKKKKHKQTT